MSFEPTSGYSTTRTSTVFSDGENQQRAEVVASLNGDWVLESYSTDKSSAVVTDGVNKQRAVVTYNLNGGSGGGGSGNYLPLTGGTISGELTIKRTDNYLSGVKVFNAQTSTPSGSHINNFYLLSIIGQTSLYSNFSLHPVEDNARYLGNKTYRWKSIGTTQINNGEVINVPTTGGTMALVEDIEAAVGNISSVLDAINGESI